MRRYERSPHVTGSATRYRRAGELLGEAAAAPGTIDEGRLRAMLSDHENAPESICRHGSGPSDTKTVFWTVADVTEGRVKFGRGNPCDSNAQTYAFSDRP
jgi:isopenicillin-N N-acyltransferase-like protein